jgi:hypothetical protein
MRTTAKILLLSLLAVILSFAGMATPVHPALPGTTVRSAEESLDRQVLDCINEMRANPPAFYHKYIEHYIRQNASRFTAHYTHSLKKEMLHTTALPAFSTQQALQHAALLQLNYIASEGGRLTHSQGNTGFAQRMKNAGLHCLAENLYAAQDPSALQIVIDLLIDQNIPSLGHRKNLLNPAYGFIGIVHRTISAGGGKTIIVMDFGCKG